MADRELHTKLTCLEGLSNKANLATLRDHVLLLQLQSVGGNTPIG